jgi:hypothetical protein
LLQKQLSLYSQAKHAPKSLLALFRESSYITSYSWSSKEIKSISELQIEKMKQAALEHACFWSYDTLRLSKLIKAQRANRHTVTDNGTAMTVIQLPDDSIKEIFLQTIEVRKANLVCFYANTRQAYSAQRANPMS